MAAKKATRSRALIDKREPLDRFADEAAADPAKALMLLFWQQRMTNPEFTAFIREKDLTGFDACVNYLKVKPTIRIYRPRGLPATEAIPARGNRHAVPGRAAGPDKEWVVVQMVDERFNAFKPIENNEEDRELQIAADESRRWRDRARVIADSLQSDLSQGQFSTATITDAIVALRNYGQMPV